MKRRPTGRCKRCRMERDSRRYRLCLNCLAYAREHARRLRALWASLGRCRLCGRRSDRFRCADCLARNAQALARWRAKMRPEGRCVNCGEPSEGHCRCAACRSKQAGKKRRATK